MKTTKTSIETMGEKSAKAAVVAILAMGLTVSMNACASTPEVNVPTPTKTVSSLEHTGEKFSKKILPVICAPEENPLAKSLYYKIVSVEGNTFYEVQPEGEPEPLRVPVSDTVVHGIETDDYLIKKVHMQFGMDDSDPLEVTQYQRDPGKHGVGIRAKYHEHDRSGDFSGSCAGSNDSRVRNQLWTNNPRPVFTGLDGGTEKTLLTKPCSDYERRFFMNSINIVGTQKFMGKSVPIVVGGFGEDTRCVCDKTLAEIHDVKMIHMRDVITRNLKRLCEGVEVEAHANPFSLLDSAVFACVGASLGSFSADRSFSFAFSAGFLPGSGSAVLGDRNIPKSPQK